MSAILEIIFISKAEYIQPAFKKFQIKTLSASKNSPLL